jgi:tetratricopeptide (TPR) repeat protein/tRNA A-37 threonylcarbamoyl transferase component Bud32
MDGERILHYEIVRPLGRGGMGEVFEARDTKLQRRVALKFIAPELAADAGSARRFEREAHSAAALSHPHIATLYALERDGRALFLAMELIPGESLRARIARGPLAVSEALAIARDVAAALAHAHRRGIVHRDIKPENLMFDEEGAVKVMDFGLARAAQASRMTMTGTTLGTAAYMAPESTRGAIGAPADVFALGVTLYEMLAGTLPFPGENPLALLYMIANEEPRPLRAARPEVPEGVGALVARMLTKDPERRPDAATVARELSALTGVAPPAAEPAPAGTPGPPATGAAGIATTPPGTGAAPVSVSRTEELEVERLDARAEEPALVPVPGRALTRPRRHRSRTAGLVLGGLVIVLVFGVRPFLRWRAERADPATRALQAQALSDQAVDLMKLGTIAPALLLLQRALTIAPHAVHIRLNYAQALRSQGDLTRATATFAEVARDTAGTPAQRALAWSGMADIAMDDGSWSQAVEYLRQGFALDSSERSASQLGYALVRAAQPSTALTVLRRGLATWPGSAALHKNAGFALYQLDSLRAARAETERALALDPGFAPALGLRARLRARTGDRSGARSDWSAFLASRPSPADSAELGRDLQAAGAIH